MGSRIGFLLAIAIVVGAGVKASGTEEFRSFFDNAVANFSGGATDAERVLSGGYPSESAKREAARKIGEKKLGKTTGMVKKMYNQTLGAMKQGDAAESD